MSTISFNTEQRERLEQAAIDFLNMAPEQATAYIDGIEQTGQLMVYTGGSLINYSHLQNPDKTFKNIGEDSAADVEGVSIEEAFPGIDRDTLFTHENVTLSGYKNDFVCYDIHYRGTPEEPGITIGMDEAEGATANGAVLKTDISHLDPQVAAGFAIYYMQRFNEREFPPNMPIYTFQALDVTTENGGELSALVCVADQEGPLYIHNPYNQFAQKDPSYHIPRGEEGRAKKAEIMATAHNPTNPNTGEAKGKGTITDLDYLRNAVNGFREKGVPIPATHMQLLVDAAKYRMDHGIEFPEYEAPGPTSLGDFVTAAQDYNARFTPANDPHHGPPQAPEAANG